MGLVAAIVMLPATVKPVASDNYVRLAWAFIHGHVWTPADPNIDALPYHGRNYIIEAPLPALLLVPLVAIFGLAVNEKILTVLATALALGAAYELCRRLGVERAVRFWLVAFLGLGTSLVWCGIHGAVWFAALVCAVAFTLLALLELAGGRRAWLVALYGVAAVECRFGLVLVLPVYLGYILLKAAPATRPRATLAFAGVVAVAAALWVGYNEVRWGLPYDIGYTAWFNQDSAGCKTGGPFALRYFPMQLYAFFVQPPLVLRRPPFLAPWVGGLALTFTSPALLLAFRGLPRFTPGADRAYLAMLWLAAIFAAGPDFIYYVSGYTQFGMRHALDFEPFLFALMALGVRRGLPFWGKLLIGYSVLAGIWGIALYRWSEVHVPLVPPPPIC